MLTNIKAVMMVNKITVLLPSYQCLAGNCADTTTFDQENKAKFGITIQHSAKTRCQMFCIFN